MGTEGWMVNEEGWKGTEELREGWVLKDGWLMKRGGRVLRR